MIRLKRLAYVTTALVLMGVISSAYAFHDLDGGSYTMWNHFVSELGTREFTSYAWLFNLSLVFVGTLMGFWLVELRRRIQIDSKYYSVLIVVLSVSLASIGIFHREIRPYHLIAASLTFISIVLMTIYVTLFCTRKKLFNSLLIERIALVLMSTSIVVLLTGIVLWDSEYQSNVVIGVLPRPDIWLIGALEWVSIILFGFWVWVVSYGLSGKPVSDTDLNGVK